MSSTDTAAEAGPQSSPPASAAQRRLEVFCSGAEPELFHCRCKLSRIAGFETIAQNHNDCSHSQQGIAVIVKKVSHAGANLSTAAAVGHQPFEFSPTPMPPRLSYAS